MTNDPTDRLLQTLRIRVAGATDDMLKLELFNTVDEFLRRTSAWKEDLGVALSTTELEYPLPIPNGAVLVRTAGVTHNGLPVPMSNSGGQVMTQITTFEPSELLPDGDAIFVPDETDASSGLLSYSIFNPGYVSITIPPTEEQTYDPLIVSVIMSLASDCLSFEGCSDWPIPDWMWDMFFQAWIDGTQARMMSMMNKPWSNTTMAQYHGRRFRNQMAQHKQEAERGYNKPAAPAWRFPKGWT